MPHRHSRYQTQRPGLVEAAQDTTQCSNDADCTLMHQVAAGDHQAFETLYHRYAKRLTGYLTPLLWQRELVEEVLNDVMLTLWQQAARFNPDMQFSTWLFGMARYKALSAMRATKQHPALLPDPPAWNDQQTPEERVTRKERHQQVACALQELPPAQRVVVEFAYYQERSYQEIAALLSCPVNTVKTRMLQARRRLAPALVGLGVSPPSRRGGGARRSHRSMDKAPAWRHTIGPL